MVDQINSPALRVAATLALKAMTQVQNKTENGLTVHNQLQTGNHQRAINNHTQAQAKHQAHAKPLAQRRAQAQGQLQAQLRPQPHPQPQIQVIQPPLQRPENNIAILHHPRYLIKQQRARLYLSPLTRNEASDLARLGRSFCTKTDQKARRLIDGYYTRKQKRKRPMDVEERVYSNGLRSPLREEKIDILNPFVSGGWGLEYYGEAAKGNKRRCVASILYDSRRENLAEGNRNGNGNGDAAAPAANDDLAAAGDETSVSEATEERERQQREIRDAKELDEIRNNMEFLIQDEELDHHAFKNMHYRSDPESKKMELDKIRDPKYIKRQQKSLTSCILGAPPEQPMHFGWKCLSNYNQSLGYQNRGLEAEEKLVQGFWGIEHGEGWLTADAEIDLFGDERGMDLDGMTDEMFQPPSEVRKKLDTLYQICLHRSAQEMLEGPCCTYCRDKRINVPVETSTSMYDRRTYIPMKDRRGKRVTKFHKDFPANENIIDKAKYAQAPLKEWPAFLDRSDFFWL